LFPPVVGNLYADAILFPWIIKGETISTLVSVVNTAEPVSPDMNGQGVLHYQYWYKGFSSMEQTSVCTAQSFERPASKNDLVTFDAAGNIHQGKKLFGDPTNYFSGSSESFMLSGPLAARAFLIVDNNIQGVFVTSTRSTNTDGTLYGEAMVIDTELGAAWGYIAYNAKGGAAKSETAPVLFGDTVDLLGEVIGTGEFSQSIWLSPSQLTTKIFMTPADETNQRAGNINNIIQLCTDPAKSQITNECREGGVFDSDENPFDFKILKNIVCTSADTLDQLLGAGLYDRWVAEGTHGWSYVRVWPGTISALPGAGPVINSGNGMIIGKLEYTTGGLTINGTTIPGALNNFLWLRNNKSILSQ